MRTHSADVGVMVFGFVCGAFLAMFIAPGDVVLWIITGLVLGLFARSFFARSSGGDIFWPEMPHFAHKHHSHRHAHQKRDRKRDPHPTKK